MFDDVAFEIKTPFEEAHHNTVMVELDSGASFMISSKKSSTKDSMRLQVMKDYGLSKTVGGIFGQIIRPNGMSHYWWVIWVIWYDSYLQI